MRSTGLIPLAAILTLANAAQAQETSNPQPTPDQGFTSPDRWTIRLEPGVWFMALSGDLRLPSSTTPTTSTSINNLNADEPRISPYAKVELRHANWGVAIRGTVFSIGENASGVPTTIGDVPISAGDQVHTEADLSVFEVEGLYRFLDFRPDRLSPAGHHVFGATLDAVFGARIYDSSFDVRNNSLVVTTPGSNVASDREAFAEPLAGIVGSMMFYDQAWITLQLALGGQPFGDSNSYSLDIIVGGRWKPTEHLGLFVGYRSLFLSLQSGSDPGIFDYTGAAQGLTFGGELEF